MKTKREDNEGARRESAGAIRLCDYSLGFSSVQRSAGRVGGGPRYSKREEDFFPLAGKKTRLSSYSRRDLSRIHKGHIRLFRLLGGRFRRLEARLAARIVENNSRIRGNSRVLNEPFSIARRQWGRCSASWTPRRSTGEAAKFRKTRLIVTTHTCFGGEYQRENLTSYTARFRGMNGTETGCGKARLIYAGARPEHVRNRFLSRPFLQSLWYIFRLRNKWDIIMTVSIVHREKRKRAMSDKRLSENR